MTRLGHLWEIVKKHSIAYTYLLSGMIILAAMWQPSVEHLAGGAAMAGLTGFFSGLFRKTGFVRSFIVNGLGGILGAGLLEAIAIRLIFPLFGDASAVMWDYWPAEVAIALTGVLIAFIYRPHHEQAVAATTSDAKADDATKAPANAAADPAPAAPAPAPAPKSPSVAPSPHRFRMAVTAVIFCGLFVGWFMIANHWDNFRDGELAAAKVSTVLKEDPETRLDHLRQLPKETAYEALAHGGLDSNVQTSQPQLLPTASCAIWQAARYDTSAQGMIFGSVEDVVQVDACSPNSKLIQHLGPPAAFLFGDRSPVVASEFAFHHPGATQGRKIYWPKADGSWVLIISVVRTNPNLFLVMMPEMTGAMVVHQDGAMEDLNLRQVREQYAGAPLYPLELMRLYASARGKFRGGWGDVVTCAWSCNKYVAEISEDANNDPSANQAPYIMDTVELGQQAEIALEPKGQDRTAEWLYFDITNGELHTWVPDPSQPMYSPKIAAREAKRADPSMDQTHRRPVEPKPIVIKDVNGVRHRFYNDAVISDDPNNPLVHSFVESVVVDASDKSAKKIEFGHFDEWVQSIRNSK